MIELKNDELVVSFPEVHEDAVCRIGFQRTLRIPDDNRQYPLPPGLGNFPLSHVDDYAADVPDDWSQHGGVFLPMHQAEAMWVRFGGDYPMAVRIAAGKIDAVTGEGWNNELSAEPQDYVVVPKQPWLDGFCVGKGMIRQFVAMPMGGGYTAEEQLTGAADNGGMQLVVYPMKAKRYEERRKRAMETVCSEAPDLPSFIEMGLAPGGLMRQEVFEDPFGFDAWDQSVRSRCFVHILNSLQYLAVTSSRPPTRPPTAKQYTEAGLPWFDYYDEDLTALGASERLAGLDSVAAMAIKKGVAVPAGNEHTELSSVHQLGPKHQSVREGDF